MGFFSKLFGGRPSGPEPGLGVDELARRLKTTAEELRAVAAPAVYREVRILKRDGKTRVLHAPAEPLKQLQRTILRRVLAKLAAHPAATGFERGQSIATNAAPHVGAEVVVKMDLRDFFTQTTAARLRAYFVKIGWGGEAADLLVKLTTHKGGLPQGAPTSPRLSNLVNYALDARLFAVACKLGAVYTRYADDMTFSLHPEQSGNVRAQNPKTMEKEDRATRDQRSRVAAVIQTTQTIVDDYGYHLPAGGVELPIVARAFAPDSKTVTDGVVFFDTATGAGGIGAGVSAESSSSRSEARLSASRPCVKHRA